MRSSKKKRKKSTIAILVGAILAVQIAIFFVIRDPADGDADGDAPEEVAGVAASVAPVGTAPLDAPRAALPQAAVTVDARPTPKAAPVVVPPPAPTTETPAAQPIPTAKTVTTRKVPPSKAKSVTSRRGAKDGRSRAVKATPPPKPVPVKPPPAPVPVAPAVGKLSIFTSPSGATIALDGVFVGKSPMRGVEVSPGRHSVALSLPGYDPKVVSVRASASKQEKISERLSKKRAAVVKTPKPSEPSPVRVVAKRLPATPRVSASKEGNAGAGRGLLGAKCNACHSKRGASSIGPRRFTSSQWDRFFSRGSHDRYERIGGAISGSQIANVKSYLKSKAADSARNQGAGIR